MLTHALMQVLQFTQVYKYLIYIY